MTAKGQLVRVYYSAYSFRSYYITKRLENGLDPYTISKNCGVSIKTLCNTYDVNETWQFRKLMVRHISAARTTKPKANELSALREQARNLTK